MPVRQKTDEEIRRKIEQCVDQLEDDQVVRLDWMTVTEFMQFMEELANERRESEGNPEAGDPVLGGGEGQVP